MSKLPTWKELPTGGVIGYAAATSARACFRAYAAASLPVRETYSAMG